ncbi:MAG: DUF421 domain-containing protein [Ruminococcus sp.]|nr:DUF421 domain-containing protein [Ruminococcus sp.]
MSIVLVRSLVLYIVVIFSVRLMGKRQLGELQPTELVITILVSNIATLPLEELSIPLIIGITPILSLVCFEVIMSRLTLKFPRLRCIVSGNPKIIISNGHIDRAVMKSLRYSIDDLMTALRQNGVFKLEDVQYAVVETTGSISVLKKAENDTVTCSDLKIKVPNDNPPVIIITDGKVLERSLSEINADTKWLNVILKKEKKKAADIFIMTADRNKNYYIVDMEK